MLQKSPSKNSEAFRTKNLFATFLLVLRPIENSLDQKLSSYFLIYHKTSILICKIGALIYKNNLFILKTSIFIYKTSILIYENSVMTYENNVLNYKTSKLT